MKISRFGSLDVASLTDFIQQHAAELAKKPGLLYRGQADDTWKVESSLMRSGEKAIPRFGAAFNEFIDWVYRSADYETRSTIDRYKQLRNQPRSYSNLTYHQWQVNFALIPDLDWDILSHEYELEKLQLKLLALAQHHGMPTPLIDWSYSPYIAWWFAIHDWLDRGESSKPCVVCLDHAKLSAKMPEAIKQILIDKGYKTGQPIWNGHAEDEDDRLTVLEVAAATAFRHADQALSINARMNAQQGTLTYQNPGSALEDLVGMCKCPSAMKKFVLVETKRWEAIRMLRDMNIHGGTVYPDNQGPAMLAKDALRVALYVKPCKEEPTPGLAL